jgi:hypothetical protein
MPIAHGRPIRSVELTQQTKTLEQQTRGAAKRADRLEQRINQLELALTTKQRSLPADVPQTRAQPMLFYMPVRPDVGSELMGATVVTQRTESTSALPISQVTGSGELSLLRPGEIWAGLSVRPESAFEVRVQPSYLTEYNEVLFPYVAGRNLRWRLYHSQGYEEYKIGSDTRVIRLPEMKEFNGRAELISVSETGLQEGYVHAAAGIYIGQSEWVSTGAVEAERTLPVEGEVSIEGVYREPGHRSVGAYKAFLNNTEITNQPTVSVSQGDVLRLDFDINGMDAVGYASCDIQIRE